MDDKKRIVILGGGFAGVEAAKSLHKQFKGCSEYEIILVSRYDYIVYQPMLTEALEGSIAHSDMAASLRKLLPGVRFYFREITEIDIEAKKVVLSPSFSHTPTIVPYEHLVIALGNVTDFRQFNETGLKEHAFHFKDVQDSIRLREQIIRAVEAAANTTDDAERRQLLSFVVGGGGFSGVEIAASILDLLDDLCALYHVCCDDAKVTLIHSKDRLMDREVSESLSRYAEKELKRRGVEILFHSHLIKATPYQAFIDNDRVISTRTIVLTAPASPNPLLEKTAALPLEKGKLITLPTLQLKGLSHVWGVGDCCLIPNAGEDSTFAPPTAQFAVREGILVGKNIAAFEKGKSPAIFSFRRLGMMASLGRRRAIAELFGTIKISGFLGWLMWRAIYLSKLPGFGRKVKVAFSWLLDFFIKDEPIRLDFSQKSGIQKLHYEAGEVIFHEHDVGDFVYAIIKGEVEVLKEKDGVKVPLANLSAGDLFGEVAVLDRSHRSATVKTKTPCEIIAISQSHLDIICEVFPEVSSKLTTLKEKRQFGK